MLQPYDWNQPTNYYRLTQKSFTVVTAKLDTIYYANRLAKVNAEDFARQLATSRAKETAAKAAKLDAEIVALLTAKEALSDSKHSKRHLAAEAVNLDADIMRLMADWNSLPSQSRSDCQLEKRSPLVAVTTEAIRVRSETPTSFGKIRLLISVILLAAAIIWTRSRVDSAQGVWLVKEFFEILVQVLVVTRAMSWELGKYIATGLGMLENTIAAWVGGFFEKNWTALMQVSMAAWETWETGLLIEAVDRAFGKAFKALIDGGGLHDGLDA